METIHSTKPQVGILLVLSITTSMLLLLTYLDYAVFKTDLVIVGVLREMLVIPCLVAQPILMILALRQFTLGAHNNNIIISIALNIITIITVGFSFII